MTMMPFYIKFRHNFREGKGSWEYEELYEFDDSNLSRQAMINDFFFEKEIYHYNESYRDYDVEVIECPPKEWLEQKIKSAKNSIKFHTDQIERFNKLLETNNKLP